MAALIYMLAAMFAQVVEKMPVKQQGKRPALRKQVASWGLPPLWVPIVVGCLCATAAKDLYGVEIFARVKAVANGFHDAGLLCATIELNDGEDITTTAGLKLTISYICRCKEKGLVWLGTPCSSWIFVGRSNAERYVWWPAGNTKKAYTRAHNNLAEISANLAWLAFCLGVYVMIEQPLTSCLFDYGPVFQKMFRIGLQRKAVHLDGFGAESQKPLQLHSNVPWLEELRRSSQWRHQFASPNVKLTTRRQNEHGVQVVTGKRAAMKDSSAYPAEFGKVVGRLHAQLVKPQPPLLGLMDD